MKKTGFMVCEVINKKKLRIKGCWDATEAMIEESFMLTIFGYSAPSSDKKAVSLLKRAWGPLEKRQLEETCFIDIIDPEFPLLFSNYSVNMDA